MRRNFIYIILISLYGLYNCKDSDSGKNIPITNGDVKFDSLLFSIDSFDIYNFHSKNPLYSEFSDNMLVFYKKRRGRFAWISNGAINLYGRNFITLLITQDSVHLGYLDSTNKELFSLFNKVQNNKFESESTSKDLAELELHLTLLFFEYAKLHWKGSNTKELNQIDWYIQQNSLKYENLLDSFLSGKASKIKSFEPVYQQYHLLKNTLLKYQTLEETNSGWINLNESILLKKGDTLELIALIKKRLRLYGDYNETDTSCFFTTYLEKAVKLFQSRNGLVTDGIIRGKTISALNTSPSDLIKRILINMERCKWVPNKLTGDYLVVNIPAFKLYVYHNDSLKWSCKAIVGESKLTNNTVIFGDTLEFIVLNPYWNIPESIIIDEILPLMKNNENYLEIHNMEVIDTKNKVINPSSIQWDNYTQHFPYMIRQKPGKSNALGLVKFLFPNNYNIYMHDTPSKSLFNKTSRVFSHGCIRLEEPIKLVRFLLRKDKRWTSEKMEATLNTGVEVYIKLHTKVPIYIVYFTVWVDHDGKLNLRDDIYGHDKKMMSILFP